MFNSTATDLTTVSTESLDKWINSFDTVLLDCDGVLWKGRHAIPGSCEVTERLKALGKSVCFVSNGPVETRTQIQQKAADYGYSITKDQILSASYTPAKYLYDLKFTKKVYLVGPLGVAIELNEHGIRYIERNSEEFSDDQVNDIIANGLELDDEVGAVVVSFDHKFNYVKLLEASNYLQNPECLFLATSSDNVVPTKSGAILPAIGPHIRAIESASGRSATMLGKPNPILCQSLEKMTKIVPERTLMIGDSAKHDVLFGFNCGFQTMLVGSGINSMDDVREWQKSNVDDDKKLIPDVYLPKLGDLLPFLNNKRTIMRGPV